MFVVDTNVLVYAANAATPEHKACRAKLDAWRQGTFPWCVTWGVLYEFLRVVTHPRSDRIRKIVVESGRDGLRQWKRYRRTLGADYKLAFGEAPGPLLAMAVMTDGDNTQSQLATWYGEIILH